MKYLIFLSLIFALLAATGMYLFVQKNNTNYQIQYKDRVNDDSLRAKLDPTLTAGTSSELDTLTAPLPAMVPSPTPTPQPITILFGGDMMFDRNIRLKMEKASYRLPLQDLEGLFAQHDFVVTNLEGPITNFPSKSVGSTPGSSANFFFTFPPQMAQTLYDQHVRIVNLGNNHILNFGKDGAEQTKKYLTEAKVQYFGDTGLETASKDRVLFIHRQNLTLALVNYNQFTTNGLQHVLEDLAYVQDKSDIAIVYTHWGNEYQPTANKPIVDTAHQFVDQGADLIIGMHPHVIQNVEVYKEKRIYYSLGNLVFDQYFSPEVQKGMLVSLTIDPITKQFSFKEHTVKIKTDGSTTLERDILLESN